MNKEDLQSTLGRLRSELNALGPEAGPVKDHITSLVNDLEHQLQDLDNPRHRATLHDRLTALIEQFEAEHPSITGMLGQIVSTLANMGV